MIEVNSAHDFNAIESGSAMPVVVGDRTFYVRELSAREVEHLGKLKDQKGEVSHVSWLLHYGVCTKDGNRLFKTYGEAQSAANKPWSLVEKLVDAINEHNGFNDDKVGGAENFPTSGDSSTG